MVTDDLLPLVTDEDLQGEQTEIQWRTEWEEAVLDWHHSRLTPSLLLLAHQVEVENIDVTAVEVYNNYFKFSFKVQE